MPMIETPRNATSSSESAQPCGCDPAAKWLCAEHYRQTLDLVEDQAEGSVAVDREGLPEEGRTARYFDTGATRDTEEGKLDFEGFLSPLVLRRFAQYMESHRKQSDGRLRASDNWQKGIPLDAYMKSGWRHFFDWWLEHRRGQIVGCDVTEEALCALLFNVQGYLHELLKARKG